MIQGLVCRTSNTIVSVTMGVGTQDCEDILIDDILLVESCLVNSLLMHESALLLARAIGN